MTELLRSLPESHPRRARILQGYHKMMAALLQYQGDDGLWRQLIDHPEGTNKGQSLQYYLDRKRNVGDLHGQAPILWTASALLR